MGWREERRCSGSTRWRNVDQLLWERFVGCPWWRAEEFPLSASLLQVNKRPSSPPGGFVAAPSLLVGRGGDEGRRGCAAEASLE